MIYGLRTISYANTTQYGSNERNSYENTTQYGSNERNHLHPPYFLFFTNQT